MGFVGVTHRSVAEAEMIKRQWHHQSLPQHGRQFTKLGVWSTLHRLQTAQQAGEGPLQITRLISYSFEAAWLQVF